MSLPNLEKVLYPETIEEARGMIFVRGDKARYISGGVTFSFSKQAGVEELVSLSRLPLNFIKKKSGGIRIGATTLIAELVESRAVKSYANGSLWKTARGIGSILNRNLITVGGSLVQPFIWSDLSTVALALGASITVRGEEERIYDAVDFFSRSPRRLMKPGDLLTEIYFPPLTQKSRAVYEKFSLTAVDFAYLKVAIIYTGSPRYCRDIKIVIGGASLLPQRALAAEKLLRHRKVSRKLLKETADKAAGEVKMTRDIRCSESAKRKICAGVIRGMLEEMK
ncbi:MAG: FAD binding domain-containing protein [Candidatus Auribacterota bacterium]|nr:FAD binding domain-containing protein [Candidatus Auribacterota bacterium]